MRGIIHLITIVFLAGCAAADMEIAFSTGEAAGVRCMLPSEEVAG
jgi:hypothetical protein